MTKIKFNKQIIEHAIDQLTNDLEGTYGCDLHNALFNTDYFIIGYHDANLFIEAMGGAWKCIHAIKSYENEMFGEVGTDLSDCEKVANMIAYIDGELLLFECKSLKYAWDKRLDLEDIKLIKEELEEIYYNN